MRRHSPIPVAHRLFLSSALFLAFALPASASTIYVDIDATGADDGSSWADAYTDLQDALAAASSGDEIWVAQGTYLPDQGTGNRSATFQLISGVELYGGYAGYGEVDPDDRDPLSTPSNLSGDLLADDSTTGKTENSYHVVTGSGVDSTAKLDGFTIISGYADGSMDDERGAGMFNSSGDPHVNNCIFRDNHCTGSGSLGGGGAYNFNSSPRFSNCVFIDNSAPNGGGVVNFSNSDAIMTGCEFLSNVISGGLGGGYGAGLYNWESTPSLTDCIFMGNLALDSGAKGGGMANNQADSVLNDCVFSYNEAESNGGAIYTFSSIPWLVGCEFHVNESTDGGAVSDYLGGPVFDECWFNSNTAADSGGAVHASSSYGQILNSTLEGNDAEMWGGGIYSLESSLFVAQSNLIDNHAQWGGGMEADGGHPVIVNTRFNGNNSSSIGGGLDIASDTDATLINCLFSANGSAYGGGLANNSGSDTTAVPHLINCTFNKNNATDYGGGILCFMSSELEIDNNILYNNTHGMGPAGESAQVYFVSAVLHIDYSCVEGWSGAWGGTGNIGGFPRFFDPNGIDNIFGTIDDDCRLRFTSPCIDAGDNSVVTWPTDLDGRTRRVDHPWTPDTGAGVAPIVDMGCLERQAIFGPGRGN